MHGAYVVNRVGVEPFLSSQSLGSTSFLFRPAWVITIILVELAGENEMAGGLSSFMTGSDACPAPFLFFSLDHLRLGDSLGGTDELCRFSAFRAHGALRLELSAPRLGMGWHPPSFYSPPHF